MNKLQNTVLLTGATGFLGRSCISHLLQAGFSIHALYHQERQRPLPQKPRLDWHCVDLLNPEPTQKLIRSLSATHMLHLAWYAEPGKFWDSRLNLDWLRASVILLKEFGQSGGKRFVGAGSCAEYDWTAGRLHETGTPLNPTSLFGTCKSSLFQSGSQNAATLGVEFAWGRLFWLYGPGEDKRRAVPYVINSLLEDEETNCSEGTEERDFLYVNDAAGALVQLLQSQIQGAVNIGSGKAISTRELVETIAKMLGKEHLLQVGAIPTDPNVPPLVVADVTRLHEELKFTPSCTLQEGLEKSIDWWRFKHSQSIK